MLHLRPPRPPGAGCNIMGSTVYCGFCDWRCEAFFVKHAWYVHISREREGRLSARRCNQVPARMAGAPPRPTARMYPASALADLAVQLLALQPENDFTAEVALGGTPPVGRSASSCSACCTVQSSGQLGGDAFYVGLDRKGYVLLNTHLNIDRWPRSRRAKGARCLPIRLVRWLVQAGEGVVVRHSCDNPACIRRSHLVLGTQADNLRDSLRRRRRGRRA